ncbi:hypothetical protein ALC57_14466 [Trachymyrmex cornetzi]|uniref:Uncharacterized protein n=1 Tax=Trachymyrmex cornetzi TaxID=471704 RepID=A0A195DKP9_9HYME|nr:hypothetical protein ALC57_14466 [Trachymyrmex cornetzi]
MSTRLAFSSAQKARHTSVPYPFLSPTWLRPRLGGTASANVGESKVTREKKRRGKVGKDRVKERGAHSNEVTRKKRSRSNESLQRAEGARKTADFRTVLQSWNDPLSILKRGKQIAMGVKDFLRKPIIPAKPNRPG